ncbi:MAG: hypothetical protein RB191_12955 [Terriglobia bacterium]|nr:hypothetical protein [Terriglobia bacterium]
MTIRTPLTGNGTWTQIGTGPATVQVISPNAVTVMVEAAASSPTGVDGLALNSAYPVHHFTSALAIWASVLQTSATAIVAVQPEAT